MAPQQLFTVTEADGPPAARIKAAANALWAEIYAAYGAVPATGPRARPRAIARTKLEECMHWTLNTPNGG